MKGILFGGCSFTWGQGLYFYSDLPNLYNPKNIYEYRRDKVTTAQIKFKNTLYYPRIVANHFGTFEVVKDLNGGSEDEIFEFFKDIFKYHYTYHDFDYIVIQLSSIIRNKFYFNINGRTFSSILYDGNSNITHYMNLNNYTFEDLYNEFLDQQFERLKNELIFYENTGIKIKIILTEDNLLERIQNDEFFNNKLVTLNYDNKIFNTALELRDGYPEMYIISDPYFKHRKFNDYHPSKLFHQVIANGIIKSIEKDIQ